MIYSPLAEYIGTTAKIGPLTKGEIWDSVRYLEDKFLTHLIFFVIQDSVTGRVYVVGGGGCGVAVVGVEVRVLELDGVLFEWPLLISYLFPLTLLQLLLLLFVWPPHVFCHNLLNLAFWHSMMLLCLASLTIFINTWHSLKIASSKILHSWFIHISLFILFSSMVLLIVLLIVFLSFTLTRVLPVPKHLNVNILWLLKLPFSWPDLPIFTQVLHFLFQILYEICWYRFSILLIPIIIQINSFKRLNNRIFSHTNFHHDK